MNFEINTQTLNRDIFNTYILLNNNNIIHVRIFVHGVHYIKM